MGPSNLVRWAGLAAMVGGVLWALWTVGFNFVDYAGEIGTPAYERYEAYNRLLPLVVLPVMVGFLGLHAAQRRSYGWLGRAGLVTALLELALAVAGSVGEFWVFTAQPYEANGRATSWTVYLLGHLVLAVGSVLFGIASVRAKVLARKPAMTFAVLGGFAVAPFFGAVIFAVPFAWLGYALWSGKVEPDRQTRRVR